AELLVHADVDLAQAGPVRAERQHPTVRSGLIRPDRAQPAAFPDRADVVHRSRSDLDQRRAAPYMRLLLALGAAGYLEVPALAAGGERDPQLAEPIVGVRHRSHDHPVGPYTATR